MTRRERLERKLELRQEWAQKRQAKANIVFARAEQYRGDYAFNTQPGHIPERARLIRAEERAFEDVNMANHHKSCAAGIETALDRSIFSDDDNAIEALEQRIAEHEAEREKMRNINRFYRKGDAAGLAALGADYERLKRQVDTLESWQDKQPYAKYELSNLGGRISADRKRLEYLKEQRTRTAKAEESPNGVTLEKCSMGYVRVTFAEKPDREVLNALRAAGFHWGGGSWAGQGDKLPAEVKELLEPKADDHSEPTYENQLWHARKLLAEQGPEALNNPHAMTGRTCGCGTCFCCAAAQVLQESAVQS